MEKIERGRNRVDVKALDKVVRGRETSVASDDLTGSLQMARMK